MQAVVLLARSRCTAAYAPTDLAFHPGEHKARRLVEIGLKAKGK
jgi:hypothetical protein